MKTLLAICAITVGFAAFGTLPRTLGRTIITIIITTTTTITTTRLRIACSNRRQSLELL